MIERREEVDRRAAKVVDKLWDAIVGYTWFECRLKADEQGASMEIIVSVMKNEMKKVLVRNYGN